MRRLTSLITVLAVLAVIALRPGTALGHAALVSSDPAPNAFLQKAPSQVSLTFSEPLDTRMSTIQLLDAGGVEIGLTGLTFSPDSLSMTAQVPKLGPGIYNVLWVNLSSTDGHSLRGSYPFTVLNPDGSVPAGGNSIAGPGGAADPAPLAEGVAVRALSLLGLVVITGGALLVLLWGDAGRHARGRLQLTVCFGATVLGIATALNLVVIHDAYTALSLQDTLFHTTAGRYWLTRLGVVLVVASGASFLTKTPRRASTAILFLSGLYLWAYTATSHAAAGTGSAWARALDFAHGYAAITWVGAVIGVAISARMLWREGHYAALMPRFSLLASVTVFVLLVTGLFSSFIEVDTPAKLWETRYGVTLLVKIGLMVPLLLIGFYNTRIGRHQLAVLAAGEPRRFILITSAEIALGLGVLLAASFLTQTTVAKAIVTQRSARPFAQTEKAGDINIALHVDPNRTGLNTFQVVLTDDQNAKVEVQRVRLTFRYRDDQTVGPSTLILTSASEGTYSGRGPYLPLEGNWQVEVEVRRDNVDDAVVFFAVRPAGQQFSNPGRGSAWDDPAPNLSWNEFGGLLLVAIGFGFALFRGVISRTGRHGRWAANGGAMLGFGMGVLLLFGVHAHPPAGPLPVNPIFPDANSVSTGRSLYTNNCATCHGKSGVPPRGLNLSPYPLDLTIHAPQHPDGQLYNFIAHGVAGSAMVGWLDEGKLSQEQIWHLVNFLRTLTPQNQ
ncbi:MAG: copper resistance protein CopC [Dehalococcoidia bacterium]|nr:copper resistance protein CopC [Dehalococcoidia bacterium]